MKSREAVDDWLSTAHARSGVNCSGCHELEKDGATVYLIEFELA